MHPLYCSPVHWDAVLPVQGKDQLTTDHNTSKAAVQPGFNPPKKKTKQKQTDTVLDNKTS